MSKRITIMIDDDIHEKLRIIQAHLIRKESSSYSFSKVINKHPREAI